MEKFQPDSEKQAQARIYARLQRRLMLAGLGFSAIYLVAWVSLGWSLALRQALLSYTQNEWLLVVGFAFVFGGILFILDLPLSFLAEYILPHRFGQSNQTLRGWISDQLKGLAIGGVIGLLVLQVIYAILRAYPTTWWLWAGGFLLFLNVILANLAPVLLLPLFYKFRPLGEEYSDLEARLLRLAEQAKTEVRGVYQFDMSTRTKAANAALAGIGNTRRIILGDTLLKEFSSDEIETVLAHELGHHVHRDIPLLLVFQSALTLGGLYLAAAGLDWGASRLGITSPADVASMPLLGLVMAFYGLVTMPVGNAFSRWRERLADQYALQSTGKGEAYASALIRLADQNLAEVEPDWWVEFFLHSHPGLGKRIRMAQEFGG